jgi:hypothetical protein
VDLLGHVVIVDALRLPEIIGCFEVVAKVTAQGRNVALCSISQAQLSAKAIRPTTPWPPAARIGRDRHYFLTEKAMALKTASSNAV